MAETRYPRVRFAIVRDAWLSGEEGAIVTARFLSYNADVGIDVIADDNSMTTWPWSSICAIDWLDGVIPPRPSVPPSSTTDSFRDETIRQLAAARGVVEDLRQFHQRDFELTRTAIQNVAKTVEAHAQAIASIRESIDRMLRETGVVGALHGTLDGMHRELATLTFQISEHGRMIDMLKDARIADKSSVDHYTRTMTDRWETDHEAIGALKAQVAENKASLDEIFADRQ